MVTKYLGVIAIFVVMVELLMAKSLMEKGLVGAVFPLLRHLELLIARSRLF
jgi:hypothetical protein